MLYFIPPNISQVYLSLALQQCEQILGVAFQLVCVPVTRSFLVHALGQFGQLLNHAIAMHPQRLLILAIHLQSANIFREAILHIVGASEDYADGRQSPFQGIPKGVIDLINIKIKHLRQTKQKINESLFLSTILIDSERINPSSGEYTKFPTWLVVQIWRDWFSNQLAECQTSPEGVGQLYRRLFRAGNEYLEVSEIRTILEGIKWNEPVNYYDLDDDLNLMKDYARDAVRGLCKNHSMLDLEEAGISYLTCTWVENDELPWNQKQQHGE
jgi:hypothetical protein